MPAQGRGQAHAGGPWGERPCLRWQRTRMQAEPEDGKGSVLHACWDEQDKAN